MKQRVVFWVLAAMIFGDLVKAFDFLVTRLPVPVHPVTDVAGLFIVVFGLIPLSVIITGWIARVLGERP
ncbi:hypothetical protein [Thermaerobacter litoralis]